MSRMHFLVPITRMVYLMLNIELITKAVVSFGGYTVRGMVFLTRKASSYALLEQTVILPIVEELNLRS